MDIYRDMLRTGIQRSYTRQPGFISGLGQPEAPSCPTGYRYDKYQGRCIANPPANMMYQRQPMPAPVATTQPVQRQPMIPQQPAQTQPAMPQQKPATNKLPSPNQLSPYALLLAQAVDLTPPQQPAAQQNQSYDIRRNLLVNNDFQRMLLGR